MYEEQEINKASIISIHFESVDPIGSKVVLLDQSKTRRRLRFLTARLKYSCPYPTLLTSQFVDEMEINIFKCW